MDTAWNDPVYPLSRHKRWHQRLARLLLCDWLQCHYPAPAQVYRPTDPTLSQGLCGRCGGLHLWRAGRWIATHA
jgi:hypothetical protein